MALEAFLWLGFVLWFVLCLVLNLVFTCSFLKSSLEHDNLGLVSFILFCSGSCFVLVPTLFLPYFLNQSL